MAGPFRPIVTGPKRDPRLTARPTGFEHLYDDRELASVTLVKRKKVGTLIVEWGHDTPISASSMESAFRTLAKRASQLQKDLGPAWSVFLVPATDSD